MAMADGYGVSVIGCAVARNEQGAKWRFARSDETRDPPSTRGRDAYFETVRPGV